LVKLSPVERSLFFFSVSFFNPFFLTQIFVRGPQTCTPHFFCGPLKKVPPCPSPKCSILRRSLVGGPPPQVSSQLEVFCSVCFVLRFPVPCSLIRSFPPDLFYAYFFSPLYTFVSVAFLPSKRMRLLFFFPFSETWFDSSMVHSFLLPPPATQHLF